MGPKKDKKGDKKGKKVQEGGEERPDLVDRGYFEALIAQNNAILSRLRSRNFELEEELDETKKALQKLDEDRADIIAYLKRTLQSKGDEIKELKQRLAAVQQAREIEKQMFLEKIKSMEFDFKVMHDQLTAEIKLLTGKLNAMEEFRAQREELMSKFLIQETAMEEQEERHKQTLYEMERKFIIAKDELKKEMEKKLLQLSLDFQNATQMRIAATTQRVIRENVAVNNELVELMDSWRKLTDVVGDLKEKEKLQRLEIELHEQEKQECLKRNNIQEKIIHTISEEHEKLYNIYNNMCYTEKRSQTISEDLQAKKIEINKIQEKIVKAEELIKVYEVEHGQHNKKLQETLIETARLESIVDKARQAVMDCVILGRDADSKRLKFAEEIKEEEEEEEDEESEKDFKSEEESISLYCKDALLSTLLALFDSAECKLETDPSGQPMKSGNLQIKSINTIVEVSGSYIYNLGDLGIIPKSTLMHPPQTKPGNNN